ncbi:superinfection exclusion B family protein [Coprococcus phoceensis]|uniref:superinfection exclusion B family protein n=1 Tax=Coprococcus phoceensis TaxID=1870993 RepID=UPI00356A40D9
MDVKIDIPEWLKIPLHILLPALWIFGCLVLFLPDTILEKINILSWRNENGFRIGVGFLIVTCLLIIYVVYFGITLIRSVFLNITRNRRTINKISRMNDMEQAIIFHMYNKPGYTMELNYNDPITKGLLARNYIYTGNNQIISMDVFTNALPIKATLQPFVYQAIDAMKPKMKKEIKKQESKIKKETNASKKPKLNEEIINMKKMFEDIFGEIYVGESD